VLHLTDASLADAALVGRIEGAGPLSRETSYDHSRGRPPGQTRIDNLAPLTRKPHRAKTARRWRVLQDENGWLEWISPAGYRYAVGPLGTLPLAPLARAS
jgi:hypothetical protein